MRKRFAILTSTFFLSAISLSAQVHNFLNEDYDVRKFRVLKINIPAAEKHITLQNISAVVVVDARPDTSSIGFMQKHPVNRAFVKLNKSVKSETEDFINSYLQINKNDSSGVLVMVLKKMWVTDELDIVEDNYLNDKISSTRENTSGIKMKAEFYYKKENDYYPLYRYDSTLTDSFTVTTYGAGYIHDAIISSLSKMTPIAEKLNNIGNKRKLTWEQISRHNDEDFNFPVLKDAHPQRGVYTTFDEFKSNNPKEKNFNVKTDKSNDILYLSQPDGTDIVARDIWGYCDGQKIFIRAADNFFELQRLENAFYIYGAKKVYLKHAGRVKLLLRPLQLDWDTGKLD